MEQLVNVVELYNPNNAKNLTDEQILAMQHLTEEQLKELAEAYGALKPGYLVLLDKSLPLTKQAYGLSSWKNLYLLISKNKVKKYVAFNFKVNQFKQQAGAIAGGKVPVAATQDLTAKEVASSAGITTAPVINLNEKTNTAGEDLAEKTTDKGTTLPGAENTGNDANAEQTDTPDNTNAANEEFANLDEEAAKVSETNTGGKTPKKNSEK